VSVAKSAEEFELAAKGLPWNRLVIASSDEIICIEPDETGSLLAQRRCIIRSSQGFLFVMDYHQICYPCSKLNRTCSPNLASLQVTQMAAKLAPPQVAPMTNLRRAATICSLLYETIQREKFDVSDALHHVRTAMAHLREVEAELEKRLNKKS